MDILPISILIFIIKNNLAKMSSWKARRGCTTLISFSKNDPSRVWMPNVCKCNRAAHVKFPGICDLICPLTATESNCECANKLYAGERCNEQICKSDGEAYCIRGGSPKPCTRNYRNDRWADFRICPCEHGEITGDACVCNKHFKGKFCDIYEPPPTPGPGEKKAKCKMAISYTDEQPSMAPVGHQCYCNRLADAEHPDLCGVICSTARLDQNCSCKDFKMAGPACSEEVCQLGGEAYCKLYWHSHYPRPCEQNVNYEQLTRVPFCKCLNGNLTNGHCECNENFNGTFCQHFNAPFITNQPRLSSKGVTAGHGIGIAAGIIILVICFGLCWKRNRRGDSEYEAAIRRADQSADPLPDRHGPPYLLVYSPASPITCPTETSNAATRTCSMPAGLDQHFDNQPTTPMVDGAVEIDEPPIYDHDRGQVDPPPPSYEEAVRSD